MGVSIDDVIELRDQLAQFSDVESAQGGVTRLLYTPEWFQAQQYLKKSFLDAGMRAEFDEVGNLFGCVDGSGDGPAVATGSHIDTVVAGGKLDGAFGIIGGFLAIRDLVSRFGRPLRPMRVISLAEEEGSRFPYAFWGSANLAGEAGGVDTDSLVDSSGISMGQAARSCGFSGVCAASPRIGEIGSFIELHIEQGFVLEREDASIGAVSSIVGQRRYTVTLTGEANHAGTTPMRWRRDAMAAFAEIAADITHLAEEQGDPLVLTIGRVEVEPNTVNVVPGRVEFTIDCRHPDGRELVGFTEAVERRMIEIGSARDVDVAIDLWMDEAPVPMDSHLVSVVERACSDRGLSWLPMHSGAGHDSQVIAPHVPTAMIFVPSRGGISHNPDEYTEPEKLLCGIEVLEDVLYQLAYTD